MAIEKVGVYPKWLGAVPKYKNGRPVPKSKWLKARRHHWVVRWYSIDGQKRYGKVFKTRKEAERYALELQNRANLGKADRPQKITLREFRLEHEDVMKGQVAYATLQEHRRVLKLFEKFMGETFILCKIQPRHAEAFIADRLASEDVSLATVNKYNRTLQGIFNRAIEPRGYLAEGQNPFAKIRERRITESPVRYVDRDEYGSLLSATDDLWWKAFLSVAYGSGLRRNEILHLTWADIDFELHRIEVRAKKATEQILDWEPKGRKNRVVPISDESVKMLANMEGQAREGHPYVFVTPQRLERIKERRRIGEWNSRSELVNNMTRKYTQIRCKANVAKCTIHDLRRSAITDWAKKLPIQVVQQLAGHASISTTRKYYLAVRAEDLITAGKLVAGVPAGADGS